VGRMFAAKPAIFIKFKLVRRCPFVLGRRIITLLALGAGQSDNDSHRCTPCLCPSKNGASRPISALADEELERDAPFLRRTLLIGAA
jgi:hypothetical protein